MGLQGSEAPVKKHDIVKAVGTLHGFRQKLNLEDENLLDEPEFLWEDEALHGLLSFSPPQLGQLLILSVAGYYSSVCNALEFDSRLRTLNQRVDYAFQLQSTLMDLLNTVRPVPRSPRPPTHPAPALTENQPPS